MKLNPTTKNAFLELYTDEHPPENLPSIKPPLKKPYIILTLPWGVNDAFLEINKQLLALGNYYPKKNPPYLAITSTGKVIQAINIIAQTYAYSQNTTLLAELDKYKSTLLKQYKKSKPANTSIDSSRYKFINPIIHRDAPTASHSVQKVTTQDNVTGIFKDMENRRQISDIEVFNGFCYELLLNDRAPRVNNVHDKEGNRVGVFSTEIPEFKSLHDYYIAQYKQFGEMKSPPQKDLVEAGIGRVHGAALCHEENDLHGGNIWYNPVTKRSGKIDHDQATYPITSKYMGEDPQEPIPYIEQRGYGKKPVDFFPVTQRDITNFPHLTDACPKNFSDKTDSGLLDLQGIENNEQYIHDAYSTFLKFSLLDEKVYRNIANETIRNLKLRDTLVAHKTNRANVFRKELLINSKFFAFFIQEKNLKQELLDDLAKYNANFNADSPLRVDLKKIEEQFERFNTDCVKYWEGDLKRIVTPYYLSKNCLFRQENSCVTKGETIQRIIQTLNVPLKSATAMLEWTEHCLESDPILEEKKTAENLRLIYREIFLLNGKLGVFGGKERVIPGGSKIKLANGVAAIFDLYAQYNRTDRTASETLDIIITQAQNSLLYKDHTLFNRRQTETTTFYEKIAALGDKRRAAAQISPALPTGQ